MNFTIYTLYKVIGLFVYLISVFRRIQEYIFYRMAASNMVGGNLIEIRGNPDLLMWDWKGNRHEPDLNLNLPQWWKSSTPLICANLLHHAGPSTDM